MRSNGCIGECCSDFHLWVGKVDDEDNSIPASLEDVAKKRLAIYTGTYIVRPRDKTM